MKKSKISSLKELKQEKKRLRMMNEVAKRELSHNLGLMRSQTKEFAVKKVAIPVGVGVLLTTFLKRQLSSNQQPTSQANNQAQGSTFMKTIMALVPFAMKMLENKENTTPVNPDTTQVLVNN